MLHEGTLRKILWAISTLFTLGLDHVPDNWTLAEKKLASVACVLEHFREAKVVNGNANDHLVRTICQALCKYFTYII